MKIKSLSYSTMLHILSFHSNITDKRDYIVIKTPDNPHHHWGNFLMFPSAPKEGDFKYWQYLFNQEFGHISGVSHIAFAWDSIEGKAGDIESFIEAGYTFELDDVLTAGQLHAPAKYNSDISVLNSQGLENPEGLNSEISVRQIVSGEDWGKVYDFQIYCSGKQEDKDYIKFVHKRMQGYKKMSEVGLGGWFGAFSGSELVAHAGLYQALPQRNRTEGKPGRFHLPETHPGYRRRGICSFLLFKISEWGLNEMGFNTFVIVADQAGFAGKVYKSVGFEVTEYGASLIHPNVRPSGFSKP
ncbi:MAG: GNAT family N-acetyltransferase [Bacteroidota bacterium]